MMKTVLPVVLLLSVSMGVLQAESELATLRALLAQQGIKHESLRAWPEIRSSGGVAFSSDSAVFFVLNDGFAEREIRFPRLNNVLRAAYWLGDSEQNRVRLSQTATTWRLSWSSWPSSARRVVVLELEDNPYLPSEPWVVRPNADGTLHLPARHAVVHGEKLQFEPLPYKNTLGCWVNVNDWSEWHFAIEESGRYQVKILQGCGGGQGGSSVRLRVGEQELDFTVMETGHFQHFSWRTLGSMAIEAGSQTLQVRPRSKARGAVMDLREVRLVPETSVAPVAGREDVKPNVVVFLADDQGTLDAACYGSRDLFTPNIDGLAAAGVLFTQAYAHTVCCPTRAALLTGRHPQRSGVNSWTQGDPRSQPGINMSLSEVTLAEMFKAAGYSTALVGKWHLGAAFTHGPTEQGFDEFYGHRGGFIDNYLHYFLHGNGFHDLYRGKEEIFERRQFFPDRVVEEATKFIRADREGPFFLYVAFNTPHYPEQSDAMFDQRYDQMKMPRRSYAKVVSMTDERIGRIMRSLDLHGLREETVILFLSDNGHSAETSSIRTDQHKSGLPKGHNYGANGGGGNTGRWRGHKGTFFEGGIRVPAILSYPVRLPSRKVCDEPVILCDWLPTLLELCDVPVPEAQLDGRSLVPLFESSEAKLPSRVLHWQWQKRWAVREGDWKLIQHGNEKLLLSLADDKPEMKNYIRDRPDLARRLERLHEDWASSVRP